MRSAHSEVLVYVHLVWATKSRSPLLAPTIRARVYGALAAEARAFGFEPVAMGGTADHVHALVRCPLRCDLPAVLNAMKGKSSHLINHAIGLHEPFAWQQGYSARSVDPKGIDKVVAYIADQEDHHRIGAIHAAWEPT